MKKSRKLLIPRSSDYLGGAFGFTIRHFVIYPPSVSVNDILRVKFYFKIKKKTLQFSFFLIKNKK